MYIIYYPLWRTLSRVFLYIFLYFSVCLTYSASMDTYIPKNAYNYLPTLREETNTIFSELPTPWYFGGLIEQESCISLTHKRCWSPTAELNTKRELGVGLGMVTKAYNADGSIRFDTLADVRRENMKELKELSWSNIRERPDLQMRIMIIMTKKNYGIFHEINNDFERLAMTDVAYNAGPGRVKKNRLKCSLTKGCDPNKWFHNVEEHCTASKKPIYGDRSACMIMNEHAEYVLKRRMKKYKPHFTN